MNALKGYLVIAAAFALVACSEVTINHIEPSDDSDNGPVADNPHPLPVPAEDPVAEPRFELRAGISRELPALVAAGQIRSAAESDMCLAAGIKGRANSTLFNAGLYVQGLYFITRAVNDVNLLPCPDASGGTESVAQEPRARVQSEERRWWERRVFFPGEMLLYPFAGLLNTSSSADRFNARYEWVILDDGLITSRVMSLGNIPKSRISYPGDIRTRNVEDAPDLPIDVATQIAGLLNDGTPRTMCLNKGAFTHALCQQTPDPDDEERVTRWVITENDEIRFAELDGTVTNECLTAAFRTETLQGGQSQTFDGEVSTARCNGSVEQKWIIPTIASNKITAPAFSTASSALQACIEPLSNRLVPCDPNAIDRGLDWTFDLQGNLRPSIVFGRCLAPKEQRPGSEMHYVQCVEGDETSQWVLAPTGQLVLRSSNVTTPDETSLCLSATPQSLERLSNFEAPVLSLQRCDPDDRTQVFALNQDPKVTLVSYESLRPTSVMDGRDFRIFTSQNYERTDTLDHRFCVNNGSGSIGRFCLGGGSAWVYRPDNKIQSAVNSSKSCLSVLDVPADLYQSFISTQAGNSTSSQVGDTIPVGMRDCSEANAWAYTTSGQLRGTGSLSSYCMTYARNNARPQLARCDTQSTKAAPEQRFVLFPADVQASAIAHRLSEPRTLQFRSGTQCLATPERREDFSENARSGEFEDLNVGYDACDGSDNQNWTMRPDGKVVVASGPFVGRYLAGVRSDSDSLLPLILDLVEAEEEATEWLLSYDGALFSQALGQVARSLEPSLNVPFCVTNFIAALPLPCAEASSHQVVAPAIEAEEVPALAAAQRRGGVALLSDTPGRAPVVTNDPVALLSFAVASGLSVEDTQIFQFMTDEQRAAVVRQFGVPAALLDGYDNFQWRALIRNTIFEAGGISVPAIALENSDAYQLAGLVGLGEEAERVVAAPDQAVLQAFDNAYFSVTDSSIAVRTSSKVQIFRLTTPIGEFEAGSQVQGSFTAELRSYDLGGVKVVVPLGGIKAELYAYSLKYGFSNAQAEARLLEAAAEVGVQSDSAGFMVGAALISASGDLGNDDGTQVGVGASAGVGFGGKVSFGDKGRYGGTADLKIVTVDYYIDPSDLSASEAAVLVLGSGSPVVLAGLLALRTLEDELSFVRDIRGELDDAVEVAVQQAADAAAAVTDAALAGANEVADLAEEGGKVIADVFGF